MAYAWDASSLSLGLVAGLSCGVILGWLMRGRPRWTRNVANMTKSTTEQSFSEFGMHGWKLALVVRNDLKMGKGKSAAQCAHAAVLAYKQASHSDALVLKQWEASGQTKVVLKVDDEQTLLELAEHASSIGLTTSLIRDAGRTQIAAGSRTVLGVGPGPEELVEKVTGHLKLY